MNVKTTIALIALLLVVGLYFYFVERETPPTYELERMADQASQAEGTPLFDDTDDDGALTADGITRITLRRGDETVVLAKEDGAWWQVEPVRFALNTWTLDSLIDDALGLRYLGRFTPGEDGQPTLADAGLEPARVTLTLEGDGATRTLQLGRTSLGGRGYVTLDGSTIYVVGDSLHDRLVDTEVTEWRKKSFDVPAVNELHRVTLDRGDDRIELVKNEGQWYLGRTLTARAGESGVEDVVEAVRSVYINEFISDDASKLTLYGLDDPQLTVSLAAPQPSATTDATEGEAEAGDTADGEAGDDDTTSADDTAAGPPAERVYVLRIGAPADLKKEHYFATWSRERGRSPVVFTLSRSTVEKFQMPVDDLRDPRMVTTDADDVRDLKIERADGTTIHLVRRPDGGFDFADPGPGYDVDYDTATRLIETITTAEAADYRDGFTAGAEPVATITLTRRGTGLSEQVRLYPADDGAENATADDAAADAEAGDDEGTTGPRYLAVREGEPVAYRVPADALTGVFEPVLTLRDKDVLDLTPEQITRLTLQRDDGATFTFERTAPPATQPAGEGDDVATAWQLQGHDSFERDALDSLIAALTPMRIEQWVTEPVQPGEGWVELTIETAEGSPRILQVDPATRRGRLSDVDAGFLVSESLVNRLTEEYRPRTVLPLTVDQIASVTVTRGDRTLTVERDGSGDYRLATSGDADSHAGPTLDTAAAGKLFDALAGLRAERFVTATPAGEPTRRITVQATGDTTYELALYPDRLATVDGRSLRLSEADLDALTASVIEGEDDEEDTSTAPPAPAADPTK